MNGSKDVEKEWQELKKIWKDPNTKGGVLLFALALVVGILLGRLI